MVSLDPRMGFVCYRSVAKADHFHFLYGNTSMIVRWGQNNPMRLGPFHVLILISNLRLLLCRFFPEGQSLP